MIFKPLFIVISGEGQERERETERERESGKLDEDNRDAREASEPNYRFSLSFSPQ